MAPNTITNYEINWSTYTYWDLGPMELGVCTASGSFFAGDRSLRRKLDQIDWGREEGEIRGSNPGGPFEPL